MINEYKYNRKKNEKMREYQFANNEFKFVITWFKFVYKKRGVCNDKLHAF